MRSRRPGGGGRGRGRDLSPNPPTINKVKDHHSGWRHNPFHLRPRRSLSPPIQNRPRRSPGCRSGSIERRDYASRQSDHGKQLHREHLPPPQSRNHPPPLEDEGFEFQHQYILPDHPTDLNTEVNLGLKPSRAIKDKDFHHQGDGASLASSGIDGQGIQVQKSMFLDEGSIRPFLLLSQDIGHPLESAALNTEDIRSTGGNLNVGICRNEMPRYHDHLRDPYDDSERDKAYLKDVHFPVMPPSQPRSFSGASSSSFAKDNFLGFNGDLVSDGYDRCGVGKYTNDPLEHNGYKPVQLYDPLRRSPPARDEPWDYAYDELLSRRGRGDYGYLASDDLYRKMPLDARGEFRETQSSSFMDLAGDRVDRIDASHKNLGESSFWDQHRSLHGDATLDFRDLKGVREDYVGSSASVLVGFRVRSSRDHELTPFEESYSFGTDVAPMAYSERPNSPLLSDRHMDMFRQGVSPPRGKSRMDDLGIYDLSSERMVRRKYVMSGDVNRLDSKGMFPNDRNAYRRIQSLSRGDEMPSNEERAGFLPSKKMTFGCSQYRMPSHRMPRSDAWLLSGDFSTHVEGGRGISLKKRLRPGPSEFHGSFSSERRQDFSRPYKFWKRGMEDRHGGPNRHDGEFPDDDALPVKNDPPEDSEEFNKQVQKAFLRFSKLLNESPHQQKRYRDQGKSGSLLCCICGSFSKEFVDTHSLVTHTYHSLKVGFRTEHLGFHKALCVLMDWSWLVAPDNSKVYQSKPVAEAETLKEDLILWPPVVIIHNSSIGNKNNAKGPKVVTIEGMEERLREMGFGAGKNRVSQGKPENQCVLLVKFMPTFSGLQAAERLHKHYAGNNRGRQEFQLITSNNGGGEIVVGKGQVEKEEELLYGYMAIAGDLEKLDSETKKRCLVKSKKDIEAIADAPLNTD